MAWWSVGGKSYGAGPVSACSRIAAWSGHRWVRRPCSPRSEEHTSELQSLMRISYAVFSLKKKNNLNNVHIHTTHINISNITTVLLLITDYSLSKLMIDS